MKGLEVGVVMIIPAVVAIVLLVVVMMRNVVVIAVEAVEGVHGGSTCEDIRDMQRQKGLLLPPTYFLLNE